MSHGPERLVPNTVFYLFYSSKGDMISTIIGMSQSFGCASLELTPDVKQAITEGVLRSQSHEIPSASLLDGDEKAIHQSKTFPGVAPSMSQEVVLTISGEDDDYSTYSRSFKIDSSDPDACKQLIAQEIECALSEDSADGGGEAMVLTAEVIRPEELVVSKSKSWGSRSFEPNVSAVADDEYPNQDSQSLSTVSTSVRREPRNDLKVEIERHNGHVQSTCGACASISALLGLHW